MLLPTLLIGLTLAGAGVGVQAVDTPQGGLPSAAARTAGPPSAEPPAAAPQGSVVPTKTSDADTVTCKLEREPNSMFSSRTCHTKAQWAEIAKEAREFVNGTSGHFGCSKTSC